MFSRVLVTGAAGGLGRVMCRHLSDAGYKVRALVMPEQSIPLPSPAVIAGYVQDETTVAQALKGVDAVIHCAALLPNALDLPEQAFQDVNVRGVATVMRQARAQGVRRLVFFSTISVVDCNSRTITRADLFDFVRDPHTAYLRSKIDAEKFLIDQARSFAGQLAVIRPAFIYGPGNYSVWREPLELTRNVKMRLVGGGKALLPLIYADDIARYVLALFEQPAPLDRYELHIVSNPQPTTMRDVFNFIADYFGVPRPRSVPALPLSLAAKIVQGMPMRTRTGRLKLLTPARVAQFSRGYDLSLVLDQPLLKQIRLTDYRDGLRRMLDDFSGPAAVKA